MDKKVKNIDKLSENNKTNIKKVAEKNKDNSSKNKNKESTKKEEKKKLNKIIKEEKINKENKFSFSTLEVIILIIISVLVSLIIGFVVSHNLNKNKINTNDKYLDEFINNYNKINNNYYKDIDKKELINNAIKGMLNSLDDDYSYLIEQDDTDNFDIQLEGKYEGIGIEIIGLPTGEVSIYKVYEDTPASKAGLQIGDIIKSIDDENFENSTPAKISKYIRNNNKNEFKIRIERNKEELILDLKRDSVIIKSVHSKIFEKNDKKIGYIYIEIFSNEAYKQFKSELEKLESSKIDFLIIDVRDNSGGHLTTSTNIISLFLDSKHVIYQTKGKKSVKKYYSSGNKNKEYPIFIIQNSNSASASEMLSIALKEEYGATIVGEKSFGKGTVQELFRLKDGAEYKITTKQWLSPQGKTINKKGVEVDIEVSLDENYKNNPTDENDNQLQKAIEEISKK